MSSNDLNQIEEGDEEEEKQYNNMIQYKNQNTDINLN